jgi:NADH-quinone oxidoreductase subunit L
MFGQLLEQYPGYLFVAATLIPLASFVLIFLGFGVCAVVRRYRDTPAGEALYNLLTPDVPSRVPAYVALGAIALAFVCSLTGFVLYNADHSRYETSISGAERQAEKLREELKEAETREERERLGRRVEKAEEEVHRLEEMWETKRASAWKGSFEWLRVRPAGLNDPDRGTVLPVGFAVDHLSAVMFVMVTLIAGLIHLFSIGYMGDELAPEVEDHQVHTGEVLLKRRGRYGRFFMYLSLFCFSMLNLVLADNLFQVFISWELVGVCSYLLIGFYYERNSASNAANKAFIVNRVGDAGFIVGLLILWTYVGTFNFEDLFKQVRSPREDARGTLALAGQVVRAQPTGATTREGDPTYTVTEPGKGSQVLLFPRSAGDPHESGFRGVETDSTVVAPADRRADQYGVMPYWLFVLAGLGIFLGCVGKSAQFPLQVWLPDAMEGPTPVSALIHAATMVAAGVYLVGRAYPLFAPEALVVIAYTGGITLFVAATIAVVMTDIKKVLAYSTVSQLGYMMLALGVGGWVAGLFHLLTHAFFKALLFLCSGSVIYGCHHEQEMTRMGGLYPKMRITALTMLVGVLTIAGLPLFSGWYSKDSIMAQALGYASVHREHVLLFVLPLVTAGLTTFYMFRMWFLTFTGPPRDEHVHEHAHESPWTMTVPLVVLAFFSVVVAWGWPVWDAKASALEHNLHHAQPASVLADFGHVEDEESWPAEAAKVQDRSERHWAHAYHDYAGFLALGMVAIGIVFASLLYYNRVLDPAEARAQFPGVYALLWNKWYFDHLYSVLVVRPALVVAHWLKWFDLHVIDGAIHAVARGTVALSRGGGRVDNGVVDGLVNLVGDVTYAVGARLRGVQTGYLRSYVLFLVLAAVTIFVVLSYFVALAAAGGGGP